MINEDNEIKKIFDYSDLLVIKKTKKVLKDLEKDKKNIINEMERRGLINSGLLFKKLIDRDLESVEEIVNYQVDCDLNEISLSLTKDISDKIYLRAKTNAENGLNILNGTLRNYGRLWNKNENLIISMKSQYNNKIAHILDDARLEINIHKKKFEMEISNHKKIKVIDNITNKNQESNKIEENNKEPNIFLSYSHKDKKIANRVDDFFISKKLSLTRDEKDASPYSDLKKFMDTIRDHDYVIMLISDAYLKSTNCMYEVVQFIQEKNYSDRIFPIIIDNEVNIFDQSEHSKYINYWQVKHKELGDKIKTLKNNGIISLQEELDKINIFQSNIGKFLKKIVELKCIPLDELESTNYKAILDKISKTFDVLQKKEVEIKSDKLKLRTDDKRVTESATKTITLAEPVPLGTPLTKDGITVTVQRIERVEQPIWGQPFEVNIYFGVINNSKQVLLATGSLFYALDEKIYEDEFNAGGYGHIGDAISWIYPGQSRSVGYTKFFHSSVTIKQITWTGTFADDQTEIKLGQWKN